MNTSFFLSFGYLYLDGDRNLHTHAGKEERERVVLVGGG